MRATRSFGRLSFIPRFIAPSACACLALLLAACGGGGYGGGGGGGGGGNLCGGQYVVCPLPMVTLTAPAAGTVSGTVALKATASGSMTYSITVTRVDFYVGATAPGTLVGTATTSPYSFNWDSTTVADGSYVVTAKVTDSRNDTATTPPTAITVKNHAAASVPMMPAQIFPAPRSSASGMAHLTANLETGAVRGKVQLNGVTATAVTINEGFAGSSGSAVIHLTPAAGAAGAWEVPAGALLAPEQASALTQGKLYVIATSAANPRGEIRGQIAPENIIVSFSAMAVTPDAASFGIAASGVAATTVDTSASTLTIHVNSTGVDDAMRAQASTGAQLAELTKDSVSMGHWSTELAAISAADLASFKAGKWQVSVATPAVEKGAIRGQIGAGKTD